MKHGAYAGKKGVTLLQASLRTLEMIKAGNFLDDVHSQMDALSRLSVALKASTYDPNYSSPFDLSVPAWEVWSNSKSGRYHALIAEYRRIKNIAGEARIGHGPKFFSFHTPEAAKGTRD
eukprot:CAMPEP_0173399296 /NCGR_PEP_ID=MMETSP1356-20130122/44536_1 /TAXON_ID=77927 ORGANISM="Hemiselmis virescens, Strain PCC157" /NCGR_SAMPLE_ID=MMETSP1356 /ASSEMBLY_ACC=CAM_ASM_000847 /LENGTH=118 /DNA_ID=CAMNT_0014358983 /DNA_START=23 /DNA_END=376 /DNA_ORIENTATION=-